MSDRRRGVRQDEGGFLTRGEKHFRVHEVQTRALGVLGASDRFVGAGNSCRAGYVGQWRDIQRLFDRQIRKELECWRRSFHSEP